MPTWEGVEDTESEVCQLMGPRPDDSSSAHV